MRGYGKFDADAPERLYFTADPHFFHEGSIRLCPRPFSDADEMNETLIRNWNGVVPENGEVFVLGDMFHKAGEMEKCARVMERLHGTKYLVAGNHDKFSKEEFLALGFEDAWDYLEIFVKREKKKLIVCSHYPLLEWNGLYRGAWHIFGGSRGVTPWWGVEGGLPPRAMSTARARISAPELLMWASMRKTICRFHFSRLKENSLMAGNWINCL